MPKKKISPKTRAWERGRRERLNICFNNLNKLLPSYDPSAVPSKVDILQKATNYIGELQQENQKILQGKIDEATFKEIEQLKQRVEDLLKRVHQLVDLLHNAGITIPHHLVEDRPHRWTNKIKPEEVQKLLEKEKKKKKDELKIKKKVSKVQSMRSNTAPLKPIINNSPKTIPMKEINSITFTSNIPSIPKKAKSSKRCKDQTKSKKQTAELLEDKLPTVAQLLGLSMNDIETSPAGFINKAISVNNTTNVANSTLINTTPSLPPGFIVIQGNNSVQQTTLSSTSMINQPCIVMPTNTKSVKAKKVKNPTTVSQPVSNSTSKNTNKSKRKNVVAVTKSHLLTAPIIATSIQTCPPATVLTTHRPGLAGLGPGTLILANGNIVPVLPPPQTLLTAGPTQFIVNSNSLPPAANPPLIMMQHQKTTVTLTTSSSGAPKVTPRISKPQKRSFPVLKQKVSEDLANKVAIPPLNSKHQPQIISNVAKSPSKPKRKCKTENVKTSGITLSGNNKKIKIPDSRKNVNKNQVTEQQNNTIELSSAIVSINELTTQKGEECTVTLKKVTQVDACVAATSNTNASDVESLKKNIAEGSNKEGILDKDSQHNDVITEKKQTSMSLKRKRENEEEQNSKKPKYEEERQTSKDTSILIPSNGSFVLHSDNGKSFTVNNFCTVKASQNIAERSSSSNSSNTNNLYFTTTSGCIQEKETQAIDSNLSDNYANSENKHFNPQEKLNKLTINNLQEVTPTNSKVLDSCTSNTTNSNKVASNKLNSSNSLLQDNKKQTETVNLQSSKTEGSCPTTRPNSDSQFLAKSSDIIIDATESQNVVQSEIHNNENQIAQSSIMLTVRTSKAESTSLTTQEANILNVQKISQQNEPPKTFNETSEDQCGLHAISDNIIGDQCRTDLQEKVDETQKRDTAQQIVLNKTSQSYHSSDQNITMIVANSSSDHQHVTEDNVISQLAENHCMSRFMLVDQNSRNTEGHQNKATVSISHDFVKHDSFQQNTNHIVNNTSSSPCSSVSKKPNSEEHSSEQNKNHLAIMSVISLERHSQQARESSTVVHTGEATDLNPSLVKSQSAKKQAVYQNDCSEKLTSSSPEQNRTLAVVNSVSVDKLEKQLHKSSAHFKPPLMKSQSQENQQPFYKNETCIVTASALPEQNKSAALTYSISGNEPEQQSIKTPTEINTNADAQLMYSLIIKSHSPENEQGFCQNSASAIIISGLSKQNVTSTSVDEHKQQASKTSMNNKNDRAQLVPHQKSPSPENQQEFYQNESSIAVSSTSPAQSEIHAITKINSVNRYEQPPTKTSVEINKKTEVPPSAKTQYPEHQQTCYQNDAIGIITSAPSKENGNQAIGNVTLVEKNEQQPSKTSTIVNTETNLMSPSMKSELPENQQTFNANETSAVVSSISPTKPDSLANTNLTLIGKNEQQPSKTSAVVDREHVENQLVLPLIREQSTENPHGSCKTDASVVITSASCEENRTVTNVNLGIRNEQTNKTCGVVNMNTGNQHLPPLIKYQSPQDQQTFYQNNTSAFITSVSGPQYIPQLNTSSVATSSAVGCQNMSQHKSALSIVPVSEIQYESQFIKLNKAAHETRSSKKECQLNETIEQMNASLKNLNSDYYIPAYSTENLNSSQPMKSAGFTSTADMYLIHKASIATSAASINRDVVGRSLQTTSGLCNKPKLHQNFQQNETSTEGNYSAEKPILQTSTPWKLDHENVDKSHKSTDYNQLQAAVPDIVASSAQHQESVDKQNSIQQAKPLPAEDNKTCKQNLSPVSSEEKSNMDLVESSDLNFAKALQIQQSGNLYPAFSSSQLLAHCNENTFIPISHSSAEIDSSPRTTDSEPNVNTSLSITLHNHEFSNDLFASLQVPSTGQHPESISPTAAFLLAFPLVSSSKVADMIVENQEECGSESMQGTSTLLQIGNIEPDSLQSTSKTALSTEVNVTNGNKPQQKLINSLSNNTINKEEDERVVLLSNINVQQIDENGLSKESELESPHDASHNSEKLPNADVSTSTGKSWSQLPNKEQQTKTTPKSRSVGTQSQINCDMKVQKTKPNSSQNSTVQTNAGLYNTNSKLNSNLYYPQQMGNVLSSSSSSFSSSNLNSHIQTFSCGLHQASQSSRNVSQPIITSFDPRMQSLSEEQNKFTVSSVKFPNAVKQQAEELNIKTRPVVTTQHSVGHLNQLQMFQPHKDNRQGCSHFIHQTQSSVNTLVNHPSIPKVQTSQAGNELTTMTEETRNNSMSYRPLASTSSVTQIVKNSYSSCATTNAVQTSVNSNKAYVPIQSTSVPRQPCSYNLFSNEFSTNSSQVSSTNACTQASSDQPKTTNAASFSVAHSSSNFSILSWTTLSPLSVPTNTSQHDSFHMPSQNSSTNVSQHTTSTTASLGRAAPQTSSNNNMLAMSLPINEVSEISQGCQKPCKNDGNICKSVNDGMHKQTGSFQGTYHTENPQTIEITQDVNTSALNYRNINTETQTVTSEGIVNNENFKFSVASTINGKNNQPSRVSHSAERLKTVQIHRPPVNWMTTPDIRTSSSMSSASSVSASVGQSILSTPAVSINSESSSIQANREFEFCNTSVNNAFMNNSSLTSPFDTRNNTSLYSSHVLPHSSVYSNGKQSCHMPCQKEENSDNSRSLHNNLPHQRLSEYQASGQNYNDSYSLSWPPKKVPFSSSSVVPAEVNSSNFVPSTLPTLIGDLALGTNYPSTGNEENNNKLFMHSSFEEGETLKKSRTVSTQEQKRQQQSGKQVTSQQQESNPGSGSKDSNSSSNAGNSLCSQEYQGTNQTNVNSPVVSTMASSNFLSVSQLVDQVKTSRTQVNSKKSSSNRQTGNKSSSINQTRQNNTNVGSSNKRSSILQTNTEREGSKKQQMANINFSISESTATMQMSGDSSRKTIEGNRESHYSNENTSAIPAVSQGNVGFSMRLHDNSGNSTSSSTNNHHHWLPNRGKPSRTSTSYKAPVSSYSAEALIGSSNNADTTHPALEPANNKIITLPPPVVSERFSHSQNYHHHHHPQSSRELQMPTSFGSEAVIPTNYFTPVDLPSSHHHDGNSSSVQPSSHHDNSFIQTNHQNPQSYSNSSFSYASSATNGSGQPPGTFYPPASFVSNANSTHSNSSMPSVTLPTGFLPELPSTNSFTAGILPSDSNNSLIFPPPIMKGMSTNRNSSGRNNSSYLHSTTSTSLHQQVPTRNENSARQMTDTSRNVSTSSSDTNSNRRSTVNAGGPQLHHQTNNLSVNSNNCSISKRSSGSRRRIPETISTASTSSSGISGFVDIGYLPMPPGIGSPMLGAEDAAFLGGTFLAPPGPQLYSTGSAPTPQGALYPPPPPPRPTTQIPSQSNHHSSSNLPPFSSCAPVQQNASNSRASHHQQQQQVNTSPNATNASSNSLANFNLSTIFPEINDKQVPAVSSVGFPNGSKNLASSLLPPANNSHHHATLVPPPSNETEYSHRVVPPPTSLPSNCIPPPPVPLHTNFNNLLSHPPPPPQVGRMQWP